MSTHSVAEAKNQLSRLIDRALAGEPVVITRHGHPVVEIRAVKPNDQAAREAALVLIEANRARIRGKIDAVALVRQMRDEGP